MQNKRDGGLRGLGEMLRGLGEMRGVGINLLRVLISLGLKRNTDPDYWTIGRVGA